MAKKNALGNEMAMHSLRHRAICKEGDLKASWRTDIDVAYDDARKHREDHDDHIINVVTEQTLSIRFVE